MKEKQTCHQKIYLIHHFKQFSSSSPSHSTANEHVDTLKILLILCGAHWETKTKLLN